MNRKRWLALALVVPVFTGFIAEAVSGEGLSPAERERYEQLRSTSTSEWKNVDLAEYLSLRTKDGSRLHSLAEAVALMRGTPFDHKSLTDDLRNANATNTLFRAIGLTYAENWDEYVAIVSMMAFKNGDVRMKNRIRWIAAEWPEAAAGFVEDVTASFGTDVKRGEYVLDRKDWFRYLFERKEIEEFSESRDYVEERETVFIPMSDWAILETKLAEGDILFLLVGT